MATKNTAQEIMRCAICNNNVVEMYCALCPLDLCKGCVVEHISDFSKKHDVVPLEQRKFMLIYPKCKTHGREQCGMYCEDCSNIPVCPKCITSEQHNRHPFKNLKDLMNSKKEAIEAERQRLQESVLSKMEDMARDIESQTASLDIEYEKLTSKVTKHGEEWHREIDTVIDKTKAEIGEMKKKHQDALDEHLKDVKKLISDVKLSLSEIENILYSNEVSKSLSYEIRPNQFNKLPPKLNSQLPVFHTQNQDISQLFGSLLPFSVTTEEHVNIHLQNVDNFEGTSVEIEDKIVEKQYHEPYQTLSSSIDPYPGCGLITPMKSGPLTPMKSGPLTPMKSGPLTPMKSGPLTPMKSGPLTPMKSGPSRRNYKKLEKLNFLDGYE